MRNFVISVFLCAFIATCSGKTAEVKVTNRCGQKIFVRNEGGSVGPFSLNPRASKTFTVNYDDPKPRVWALVGCDNQGRNCAGGDHNSLAEMHWSGDGKTWYDVSMVDGYTLPISMTPYKNTGPAADCKSASCNYNINNCQGQKITKGGKVVACRNPNRDDPNSNYAKSMRQYCPEAYSYSKDDTRRPSPMRSCYSGNSGINVVFC